MRKLITLICNLIDKPATSLLFIIGIVILTLVAPSIDDAIPVLSKAETSPVVYVGDTVAWDIDVCRWRDSGLDYDGITFEAHRKSGGPAIEIYGVQDIDAGQEVGTGSTNLKSGECRTYRYQVDLGGRLIDGDEIRGVAHYRHFWWRITEPYGTIVIDAPVKVYLESLIQQQLNEQRIEETKK
jgi:hypothetical protein